MPPKRTRPATFIWAAIVVGVVVFVAAIGLVNSRWWAEFQQGLREGIREGLVGELGLYSPGDCFDGGIADEGGLMGPISSLSCNARHDSELIATFDWPDSETSGGYPGEDAVTLYAESECVREFRRWVGIDFGRSVLEMSYAYPTDVTWTFGDRTFHCIVHGPLARS